MKIKINFLSFVFVDSCFLQIEFEFQIFAASFFFFLQNDSREEIIDSANLSMIRSVYVKLFSRLLAPSLSIIKWQIREVLLSLRCKFFGIG